MTESVIDLYGGLAVTMAGDMYSLFTSRGSVSWEDAKQEALLALLETYESFEDPEDHPEEFKAYLRRVISDRLTEMRARVAYPVSGSRSSLQRHDWPAGYEFMDHLDSGGTPMEVINDDDRSKLHSIYDAMDFLTARERRVMGLYYLDGMLSDYKVADALGIKQPNAYKTRARAEAKIRDFLSENG